MVGYPDNGARVRDVFADAGLDAPLDLRTLRRVERADHLEVWGPLPCSRAAAFVGRLVQSACDE